MPNYDMATLVVGGIDYHRFLLIKDYNLIIPLNNRIFYEDIGDWYYSGASVIERVYDGESQFGDYCLKITDDNAAAEEYAEYEATFDDTLIGGKFALYFWAKGNAVSTANICIVTNLGSYNVDIGLTTLWKPYIVISSSISGAVNSLVVKFKPYADSAGVGGTGIIYINNVSLFRIEYDYKLRPATSFNQYWLEEKDADYSLTNGDQKKYTKGSIYKAELFFDYLEPPEEIVKHKVFAAKKLLFVPHLDYNWAILCSNDGDMKREYFQDKYIGHTGTINLKGLEILESDPPEFPAGAGGGEGAGSGVLTMDDVIIA